MDQTRHKADCKRVFRRLDPDCPRCRELEQGAAPRRWRTVHRAADGAALAAHFASKKHRTGGCGPVCTFGDW